MHKRIRAWVDEHRRCKGAALEAGTWFEEHVRMDFADDEYLDWLDDLDAPNEVFISDDNAKATYILDNMPDITLHRRLSEERDAILEYTRWKRIEDRRKAVKAEAADKRKQAEIAYFENVIEGHKARVEEYTRKLEEVRRS